jgi:histone deacetylase 6
MERHPLLVIFHDPPSIKIEADIVTSKPELHNVWLVSQPCSLVLCFH